MASPSSDPVATATGQQLGTSAILARDLGKRYELYHKPVHRVWDMLLPGTKRRYREFWAVRNVYLDIPRASTVGIIGENGAGKSTLLKLLTGITKPTTGELRTQGRMASLLELGAGFHPEFSGRENIHLNCSILGMTPEEIEERYASIVAFSELGDFIERPVKTYSSGMHVRLGFAVAASVDPEILLIDEALAVGDEHFRGKCINRLNQFREQGRTILFVSHDIATVKSMCQHVVLMDRGEVLAQGPAEEVADAYLARVKARGDERLSVLNRGESKYPRWGSGEARVEEVRMLDAEGRETAVFRSAEPFVVRLRYRAEETCRKPVFGIGIYRSDGTYVNGSNHHWRDTPIEIETLEAGEEGEVEMRFDSMPLLAGQYYLTIYLYDHSKVAPTAIDHREHVHTFEVIDPRCHQHGLLYLPTRWVVRRSRGGETWTRESAS